MPKTQREIDMYDRGGGLHTGSTIVGEPIAEMLREHGVEVLQHMTYGYFVAEVNHNGERKWLRFDVNAFKEQFDGIEDFPVEEQPTRRQWLDWRLRDWVEKCVCNRISESTEAFWPHLFDVAIRNMANWMMGSETRDVDVKGKIINAHMMTGFSIMLPSLGLADFPWGRIDWVDPERGLPADGDTVHFRVSPSLFRRCIKNREILQVREALTRLKKVASQVDRNEKMEYEDAPKPTDS